MPDYESAEYKEYLKDQVEDGIGGDHDLQYFDWVLKKFPTFFEDLHKEALVLDIGTRTFGAYEWWQDTYGLEAMAIDVGKAGLEYCKEYGKPCIELDAHRLREQFDENYFDRITAFHSFEHMYDLPHVLGQCRECLKPGGFLFFAVPMPSYNWKRGHWYDILTVEDCHKLVTDAGMSVVWSDYLSDNQIRPQPEILVIAKK